MLAKAARNSFANKRGFSSVVGAIRSALDIEDPTCPFYQAIKADPLVPLKHFANTVTPAATRIETTVLPNGITVVSENSALPGPVTFKVLLDVGTRHESADTSGSLLSIQNTYLKTVLNTNETVNYGMVQMSGGSSSMDYDQENALFAASCLAHDAVDLFGMITDCALEPRSVVSANVSMQKGKHRHALERIVNSGIDFNDALFRSAFGLRGLGMPILGIEANIEYLNAMKIQKFQVENITPKRIFIGGANVENHQEFVDLVTQKLSFITPVDGRKVKEVERSQYIGGQHIASNASSTAHVALAYEAPSWQQKEAVVLKLAAAVLGGHQPGVITPHDRLNRTLLATHSHVDSAHVINYTFSDSGLFGLRVSGAASHAPQLLEAIRSQLQALADNLTDEELSVAKNSLKLRTLAGLECPSARLTETLKNLKTFGRVQHQDYLNWIDSVDAQTVRSVVKRVISGKPSLVATGGNVNGLSL